jgi:hypothetical protein
MENEGLRDFWDRASWRKSAKGNWWIRLDGCTVTLFPRRRTGAGVGWTWAIVRSAREGPLYSRTTYDDTKAAHAAAWEAILADERFDRQASWKP